LQNRLKELRELKGLSLDDLSRSIGIPKTSLSNYERGNREPKIEVWEKIAIFFDVPVAYLMGISNSRTNLDLFDFDKDSLPKESRKALEEINSFVTELIQEGNGWYAMQATQIIQNINDIFFIAHTVNDDFSPVNAIVEYSSFLRNLSLGSTTSTANKSNMSPIEQFKDYVNERDVLINQLDQLFFKALEK
jgi:transcriptional regulator with XRE-family HTH domain